MKDLFDDAASGGYAEFTFARLTLLRVKNINKPFFDSRSENEGCTAYVCLAPPHKLCWRMGISYCWRLYHKCKIFDFSFIFLRIVIVLDLEYEYILKCICLYKKCYDSIKNQIMFRNVTCE